MRAGGLQQEGRWEEAAVLWREITAAAPMSAEAAANLGGTLLELGAFEAAETELRRAVAMRPDAPWAHYNLGRAMLLTRRWEAAEAEFQAALTRAPADPKTRLGLAHLKLMLGDYAAGWPLYEARTEIPSQHARRPDWPNEWQGEPLAGRRLLVAPEQGFGDQIQFARFAPILRDLGADVTLVAPPELTALFASLDVEVLPQTADPRPDDLWTLLLSVPGKLGVTLHGLPTAPYLAPPPERRVHPQDCPPAGAVGVIWRGRPTPGNTHRSLPSLEALAPLAEAGATLVDLSDPVGDFAAMAAVMETLDLVVSIDTAGAHLAGAMGKPCWLLLPWFRSDWRWLQDRADSPWYPSMRLFRQPAFGAWEPVVAEVAAAWRTQFRS